MTRTAIERIQGAYPLVGGGADEEAGEAPHGHGHRGALREVAEGQHHPVLYQAVLRPLDQLAEHLHLIPGQNSLLKSNVSFLVRLLSYFQG